MTGQQKRINNAAKERTNGLEYINRWYPLNYPGSHFYPLRLDFGGNGKDKADKETDGDYKTGGVPENFDETKVIAGGCTADTIKQSRERDGQRKQDAHHQ